MIMLCIIGYVLRILNLSQITTNTPRDFVPQKEHRKEQLMSYLVHTNQCRNTICMGLEAFINLCQRLRAIGLVKNAFWSIVEEQVGKFMHIIEHNVKNQSVQFFFYQSGEIVSRHFHNVLNEVLMLELDFYVSQS